MKRFLYITICCVLFFKGISTFSQNIIFLHHSVGEGVYTAGGVASWLSNYNTNNNTDYQISERSYPNLPYPWENYPYDYWNLWLNNGCDNSKPEIACLDNLCELYDVIIFKHCFPGASIQADDQSPSISSSKKTLANYKLQYRALRDLMDTYPNNKFIIWTLAPLHRLETNTEDASRSLQFVDWVKNEWLTENGREHANIFIFDFFGYVAETNPNPLNGQVNCLNYDFEKSHIEIESHPNTTANELVGPLFAQFIVNSIKDNTQFEVTDIAVFGEGGANAITTNTGTLQLQIVVTPAHATNKSVIWSIQNETGEASISETGLVTAIANGTVTATAKTTDSSGVSGSMVITISNQNVEVTSIDVAGASGVTTISSSGGQLQLIAYVEPVEATNKSVEWSVENISGSAVIDTNGVLTILSVGTVKVIAKSTDGSNISGFCIVTIINQATEINSDKMKNQELLTILSSNRLIIKQEYKISEFDYCSIYNMNGVLMHKERIIGDICNIDISNYISGVYIVTLSGNYTITPIKVLIP